MAQTLSWTDFSGGIADNLFHSAENKYFIADNLFVNNDKKIFSRHGSTVYDANAPQVQAGGARIDRLLKFQDESQFFAAYGLGLYRNTGGGWSPVTGSSDPFPGNVGGCSYGEYPEHLYFTNRDSYQYPQKLWKGADGTWNVATAGLPQVPLTKNYTDTSAAAIGYAFAFINQLLTTIRTHFGSTLVHVTGDSVSMALIPTSITLQNTGVPTTDDPVNRALAIATTVQLQAAYINHYKDSQVGNLYHYREIHAPTVVPEVPPATELLSIQTPPTTLYEAAKVLNALKVALNAHKFNTDIHNNYTGETPFTWPFLDNSLTSGTNHPISRGPQADLDYAAVYAFAAKMRAGYNAHLNDGATATTAHSTAKDTADKVSTLTYPDPTSPETLSTLLVQLWVYYDQHETDTAAGGALAYHPGHESPPTGYTNYHMSPVASANLNGLPYEDNFLGLVPGDWANIIPKMAAMAQIMNLHMQDLAAHYTTNPTGVTVPTYYLNQIPAATTLALASYNYAFIYTYTYKTASRTFKDVGPTQLCQFSNVLSTAYQPLVITSIPVLDNLGTSFSGNVTNYDTSNVTVEIYRTQNNGSTYYKVGSVTNGTTTFSDSMPDSQLVNQQPLYTTGGVLDSWQPPQCKALHICNGTGYYGNVVDTDGATLLPNRILQSLKDAPSYVPAGNIVDLDDVVVGISSARDTVIAMCSHSVYRLDGQYDSQGRGGVVANAISRTIGCVSEPSIVRTDAGIFFWGTDGVYYTDGYSLLKLSQNWNLTYQSVISNNTSNIRGAFDYKLKRIWWAVQRSATNGDNDSCFVLDLNYGITEEMPWTTMSNSGGHFEPTALCYFGGSMLRGHRYALLFKHNSSYTSDPYIKGTGASATITGTKTIVWDFQSLYTDCGQPGIRKWTTWVNIQLRNESNYDLQVQSNVDDLREARLLGPIHYNQYISQQSTVIPGNPNLTTLGLGMSLYKRRMCAGNLRSTYQGVRFTNNKVMLASGVGATVNASGKTATLGAGSWMSDPTGYELRFSNTNFQSGFEISARTSSTVLTVLDPGSGLVNGTYGWQIWGYPKDQKFHLVDYTLTFDFMSPSFLASRSTTT